jgi:tetratricopeptide (TPR) repeat protein
VTGASPSAPASSSPPQGAPAVLPGTIEGYSVAGANAFVRAKNWNGLVAYAKAWTQAQPNEPLAWYYLANAYGLDELNQPQNAIQPYQKASQLKSPWPEVWNDLGSTYMPIKQYSEAAAAFKGAADQSPKRMQYWNNFAAAQTELGNFGLAQKALYGGKNAAG